MAPTDKDMIFIIFTDEGLEQAKDDIVAEQADLWINPDLNTAELVVALHAKGIQVFELPEQVNPNKEKAVLAALAYVEQQAPQKEILIEYL